MKHQVMAIFDNAVKAYLQPFFTPTKGSGIRSFTDAVSQEGSQFARHAGDYALFILGEFDDVTGSFSSLPQPERVMTAIEIEPGGMPSRAFQ